MQKTTDTVFQIDFQDFFSKDFVELKVNACHVFADTLTSNKTDGLTDARINIHFIKKESTFFVKHKGKSLVCNSEKGDLSLLVILNGHPNNFKIDFSKGQYIGFTKMNTKEVSINQSKAPFVYD